MPPRILTCVSSGPSHTVTSAFTNDVLSSVVISVFQSPHRPGISIDEDVDNPTRVFYRLVDVQVAINLCRCDVTRLIISQKPGLSRIHHRGVFSPSPARAMLTLVKNVTSPSRLYYSERPTASLVLQTALVMTIVFAGHKGRTPGAGSSVYETYVWRSTPEAL